MTVTFGGELRRIRIESRARLADVAAAWDQRTIAYVCDVEADRRPPPSPEQIRAALRVFGKETEFDRLVSLANERHTPRTIAERLDADRRAILIALNRDDIPRRTIEEVLALLRRPCTHSEGGTDAAEPPPR